MQPPALASGAVVATSILGGLLVLTLAVLVLAWVRLRRTLARVGRLENELDALRRGGPPDSTLPRSLQAAERAMRSVIGTAVKVREHGVSGLLMSSIDDLSRWAMEDRSEIARLAAEDGSVTIFFSDIEDSTALNTELGDEGWVQLLIAHDTLVRAHVQRRDGHIVKSQGDGFMIVFGSPADAVRAGLGIQRSLSEDRSRRLRRSPIRVRIGIHEGPAIARDGDYFGQTVAMAARVGAQAMGGQILVTQQVADDLADDRGLVLTEDREVELKGLPGTHVLWRVRRASVVSRHRDPPP
ncbi:MAG: adenylate/guanylate cyclase domain-containing protein [Actinomycetota bacterium]|nr:adenylate/guanylate cyclase domain-containing protein [Actinomycetota bacterium]